jgi:hypothetical protein
LRIEHHDGQDRTVASPLDTIEKRASLPELRSVVESMLPEVEIADVPPRGLWLDRVPR